jgi:hypothetical protein
MRPFRQQQRKSQFFEYFIKQGGEDFLMRENPVNLKRKAMMFFRDLANGAFDKDKHGQYLSDDRLIGLMLNEARIKLLYYAIHCNALNIMIQVQPESNTDDVQRIFREDTDSSLAYTIVYDGLLQLLRTKNLSWLDTIANKIRPVKYRL